MKLEAQGLFDDLPESARRLMLEYASLLRDRAIPARILANSDAERVMDRHVLDSLRVLPCLVPEDRLIADVGSGAGLPGIPVSIARPESQVLLIEPRARRAAFLELALVSLGLSNAEVVPVRADSARIEVDVCLTRALGDAPTSWALASPLLRPGGRVLYFAGTSWGPVSARAGNLTGVGQEVCSKSHFQGGGPIVIMQEVRTAL